jgi:hypothetical protein
MFDQRALPPGSQLVPGGLVLIVPVRGQRLELFQIPLREPRSALRVMLAGSGHVEVQDRLRVRIY